MAISNLILLINVKQDQAFQNVAKANIIMKDHVEEILVAMINSLEDTVQILKSLKLLYKIEGSLKLH